MSVGVRFKVLVVTWAIFQVTLPAKGLKMQVNNVVSTTKAIPPSETKLPITINNSIPPSELQNSILPPSNILQSVESLIPTTSAFQRVNTPNALLQPAIHDATKIDAKPLVTPKTTELENKKVKSGYRQVFSVPLPPGVSSKALKTKEELKPNVNVITENNNAVNTQLPIIDIAKAINVVEEGVLSGSNIERLVNINPTTPSITPTLPLINYNPRLLPNTNIKDLPGNQNSANKFQFKDQISNVNTIKNEFIQPMNKPLDFIKEQITPKAPFAQPQDSININNLRPLGNIPDATKPCKGLSKKFSVKSSTNPDNSVVDIPQKENSLTSTVFKPNKETKTFDDILQATNNILLGNQPLKPIQQQTILPINPSNIASNKIPPPVNPFASFHNLQALPKISFQEQNTQANILSNVPNINYQLNSELFDTQSTVQIGLKTTDAYVDSKLQSPLPNTVNAIQNPIYEQTVIKDCNPNLSPPILHNSILPPIINAKPLNPSIPGTTPNQNSYNINKSFMPFNPTNLNNKIDTGIPQFQPNNVMVPTPIIEAPKLGPQLNNIAVNTNFGSPVYLSNPINTIKDIPGNTLIPLTDQNSNNININKPFLPFNPTNLNNKIETIIPQLPSNNVMESPISNAPKLGQRLNNIGNSNFASPAFVSGPVNAIQDKSMIKNDPMIIPVPPKILPKFVSTKSFSKETDFEKVFNPPPLPTNPLPKIDSEKAASLVEFARKNMIGIISDNKISLIEKPTNKDTSTNNVYSNPIIQAEPINLINANIKSPLTHTNTQNTVFPQNTILNNNQLHNHNNVQSNYPNRFNTISPEIGQPNVIIPQFTACNPLPINIPRNNQNNILVTSPNRISTVVESDKKQTSQSTLSKFIPVNIPPNFSNIQTSTLNKANTEYEEDKLKTVLPQPTLNNIRSINSPNQNFVNPPNIFGCQEPATKTYYEIESTKDVVTNQGPQTFFSSTVLPNVFAPISQENLNTKTYHEVESLSKNTNFNVDKYVLNSQPNFISTLANVNNKITPPITNQKSIQNIPPYIKQEPFYNKEYKIEPINTDNYLNHVAISNIPNYESYTGNNFLLNPSLTVPSLVDVSFSYNSPNANNIAQNPFAKEVPNIPQYTGSSLLSNDFFNSNQFIAPNSITTNGINSLPLTFVPNYKDNNYIAQNIVSTNANGNPYTVPYESFVPNRLTSTSIMPAFNEYLPAYTTTSLPTPRISKEYPPITYSNLNYINSNPTVPISYLPYVYAPPRQNTQPKISYHTSPYFIPVMEQTLPTTNLVNSLTDVGKLVAKKGLMSLFSKKPQNIPLATLPPVNPYSTYFPRQLPDVLDIFESPLQSVPSFNFLTSYPFLLDDFEAFEIPDYLSDMPNYFTDLLDTPEISELDRDLTSLVPYISSLKVNVLPVISNVTTDSYDYVPNMQFSNMYNFASPSYLPNINIPNYVGPQVLELPNKKKSREKDLERLATLMLLNELLNGGTTDLDDLQKLLALLYVT